MESLSPFLQGSCIPYNILVYPGARRITGIHVSQSQEKSTRFLCALGRARISTVPVIRLRMCASRLVVPASRRTGHPFAASSSGELSQMIEFVCSASPETTRMGASEVAFLAQATNCRTWQSAHRRILFLFFL